MNSANGRSNQMTKPKVTFHRPAISRTHGLFSSRPRRLMKLCNTCVFMRKSSMFTTSDVSVSSSWFPDHLPIDAASLMAPNIPRYFCSYASAYLSVNR